MGCIQKNVLVLYEDSFLNFDWLPSSLRLRIHLTRLMPVSYEFVKASKTRSGFKKPPIPVMLATMEIR
jgi:hypothetical protein